MRLQRNGSTTGIICLRGWRPSLPLLLLIIFACLYGATAQPEITYSEGTLIYTLTLDTIQLARYTDRYRCAVQTITIAHQQEGTIIQTLAPDWNNLPCDFPPEQRFIIEDMNFDNHNDIRLLYFLPTGPTISYYCWIYTPSTGRFTRNTQLEEITSPEFDHQKKLVRSSWRSGCCDRGARTYRYVNGRLLLIEEAEADHDPKDPRYVIYTLRKRVKGKMREVERNRERVPEEE